MRPWDNFMSPRGVSWSNCRCGMFLNISTIITILTILTIELFWAWHSSAPACLAHLSTLGCRLWYWCWNSFQQLSSAVSSWFFTPRSPKIDVRGILCKSLFSKMFWKLSGDEFWVLKLFCSSKTDRVTDFFSFSALQTFELFFLARKYYVSLCRYSGVMTLFLGALNCCQPIFTC